MLLVLASVTLRQGTSLGEVTEVLLPTESPLQQEVRNAPGAILTISLFPVSVQVSSLICSHRATKNQTVCIPALLQAFEMGRKCLLPKAELLSFWGTGPQHRYQRKLVIHLKSNRGYLESD